MQMTFSTGQAAQSIVLKTTSTRGPDVRCKFNTITSGLHRQGQPNFKQALIVVIVLGCTYEDQFGLV